MSPQEEQHVRVPLTDFVRGVAEHAAREAAEQVAERVIKNYQASCPVADRVAALEIAGQTAEKVTDKRSARFWQVVAIIIAVTAIVTDVILACK